MKESASSGIAYLGAQQVLAGLMALLVQVVSGRLLGPEAYGAFSVISAVLYTLTFVFLSGVPIAASKTIAENARQTASIQRQSLILQGALGVLSVVLLQGFAAPIAARLGNPNLAPLLRLGALSLPWIALGYVYVHRFNGLRAFRKQALTLLGLNVTKTAAVLVFVLMGFGVEGAVKGLVVSAAAFFLASWWIGRGVQGDQPAPIEKLLRLGGQFTVAYLAASVWGQIDLLMLGALGRDSRDVGLFTAASTLAWAPASLFHPLLLVQFPAVSEASAAGEARRVARSLAKSLKLSFMILCPIAFGGWLFARALLGTVYGLEFVSATFVVGPLVLGVALFTLYEIIDTYLRGSGRTAASVGITCTMLALHFCANWILIPRYQLLGVTLSVVVMSGLAFVVAGACAGFSMGLRMPWLTFARTALWTALAFIPGMFWHPDGPLAVVAVIPCLVLYGILLLRFEPTAAQMVRNLVAKVGTAWVGLGARRMTAGSLRD